MADYYEAGILNMLGEDGEYHAMLAIKGEKGEKGDTGASPATETIRTLVSEEVAKVVAEAPEDFDTLKEIADWIDSHEDDAAAMNTAIQSNTTNVNEALESISSMNTSIQNNTTAIQSNTTAIQSNTTKVNKALEIVSFDATTGTLTTRTMQ